MRQKTRELLKKFFTIQDTPQNIAAGAAVGVFFGIIPGEGVLTTLVFVFLFRLNRASGLIGVAMTNMWMTALALPPATWIGSILSGETATSLTQKFNEQYHIGWKFFFSKAILFDIVLPVVSGFLIVAFAIALIVYFFVLSAINRHRKIKSKQG